MTTTYYKHELLATVNRGNAYERSYTVYRYSMTEDYNNTYNDTVIVNTEKVVTEDNYIYLDCWTVILWGKMYGISEEHSGRYVIPKVIWEDYAKQYNYDDSVLGMVYPMNWEDYDWLEPDGNEYVVLDLGGQIETHDENGYGMPIEDTDIPQLPLEYANYDYSDVGNG